MWHASVVFFFFSFWLFLLFPSVTICLSSTSHPVKNAPVFHDIRVEYYFGGNKKAQPCEISNLVGIGVR